jgi:hypothetical protein
VSDFTRDRFEVLMDLLGIDPAFAQGGETGANDL